MEDNKRIAFSLFAATVIVFGGIYLLDRYSSIRLFVAEDPPLTVVPDTLSPTPEPVIARAQHLPAESSTGTSSGRTQVFKCLVGGETIYSEAPCEDGQGGSLVLEDSSGVHMGVTRDQVSKAFSRSSVETESKVNTLATDEVEYRRASLRAHCQRLEDAVKRNDEAARRPQSPQTQDRLRVKRKALTDEMHELNCMKV